MSYWQPTAPAEIELVIKKSRFLAFAFPCARREDAMHCLQQLKQRYPDARHHCWAYVIGHPENAANAAANDDGEPSGTAGKPILNVIQHKAIGDLMLVVVRYFGGVKLGAGGLVRAYSQAADRVLQQLPVIRPVRYRQWLLQADFGLEQPLRHWLSIKQGVLLAVAYSNQVSLQVNLPEDQGDPTAELLAYKVRVSEPEVSVIASTPR